MKKRKILTMIALGIIGIITLSTTVHAAYQSVPRGNLYDFNSYSKNSILEIRLMEQIGGGMGLNEEIETTVGPNRGVATTESNNIDVHLLKNTEYGAIVLLGASDYGKQGTSIESRRMDQGAVSNATQPMASTTGNKYGIFEIGYSNMSVGTAGDETVAAVYTNSAKNYASRYVNIYTGSEKSALPGDATVETSKWHNSSSGTWLYAEAPLFNRGKYGAFHYESTYCYNYARAAVVVGKGF